MHIVQVLPTSATLLVHILLMFYFEGVYSSEPDFLYPLENITAIQGCDITFTCVVNNLGEYRVAWVKPDTKTILAIHEHLITNNARLSVAHIDFNKWTLNIRNVKREDRGQYMCHVNTDPMIMQTGFLEVVVPPDIETENTEKRLCNGGPLTETEESSLQPNISSESSGSTKTVLLLVLPFLLIWSCEQNQF